MQKILVKHFFNFKFAEAKFLHNILVQLNCIQQYLGQILVTIEKLLILQIVAFMTGLSKRKLLNNYWATLNLVNVNLLSNPNVNPKNGVAYKNNMKCQIAKIFRAGPQTPLLQSSEIPNLDLTAQIGNFWFTPWRCM